MAKATSPDYDRAQALMRAALGTFDSKKSLSKVLAQVPDFGRFEWMLTIIGLEIDLRIDIPEALADDHSCSVNDFCKAVAKLPKVDSAGYTLECLGLVAQALLSLDLPVGPTRSRHGTPTRGAKAPRKAAVETKHRVNAGPVELRSKSKGKKAVSSAASSSRVKRRQ